MVRIGKYWIACLVGVLLMTTPGAAHADANQEAARLLFKEGNRTVKKDDKITALVTHNLLAQEMGRRSMQRDLREVLDIVMDCNSPLAARAVKRLHDVAQFRGGHTTWGCETWTLVYKAMETMDAEVLKPAIGNLGTSGLAPLYDFALAGLEGVAPAVPCTNLAQVVNCLAALDTADLPPALKVLGNFSTDLTLEDKQRQAWLVDLVKEAVLATRSASIVFTTHRDRDEGEHLKSLCCQRLLELDGTVSPLQSPYFKLRQRHAYTREQRQAANYATTSAPSIASYRQRDMRYAGNVFNPPKGDGLFVTSYENQRIVVACHDLKCDLCLGYEGERYRIRGPGLSGEIVLGKEDLIDEKVYVFMPGVETGRVLLTLRKIGRRCVYLGETENREGPTDDQ